VPYFILPETSPNDVAAMFHVTPFFLFFFFFFFFRQMFIIYSFKGKTTDFTSYWVIIKKVVYQQTFTHNTYQPTLLCSN